MPIPPFRLFFKGVLDTMCLIFLEVTSKQHLHNYGVIRSIIRFFKLYFRPIKIIPKNKKYKASQKVCILRGWWFI